MKNKNYIIQKLEKLEGTLATLKHLVNRSEPIDIFIKNIESGEEIIEEIKSQIENEPQQYN
jgi:hypothetical protein